MIESTIGAKFRQSLEIKFGGAVGKVSWRLDLEIKCLRRSNRKLAAARFNCFQMSIHLKTCPSWATQPNQSEDKDNLNCFCRSNCILGNSTAVKYQFTCRLDLTNALQSEDKDKEQNKDKDKDKDKDLYDYIVLRLAQTVAG